MTDATTGQETEEVFVFPTSFAQQRLWIIDQLEPGRPTYNIPFNVRLSGPLDVHALREAFEYLVDRHETMRTVFDAPDGTPVQVVRPPEPFALPVVDISGLNETARGLDIDRLMLEQGNLPFDLRTGPLVRALLAKLGDEEHVLFITAHHIVVDGWSLGVLQRELGAAYAAFARGEEPSLDELPIQYVDFAGWQRDRLEGALLAEQLSYWKLQLAHPLPTLDVPVDRQRTSAEGHLAGRIPVAIPSDTSERLAMLARECEATPFMALLAAYQTLLHRYSGQDDIIVGAPVAGRTRRETEGLIGLFVNTLALRTTFGEGITFRQLLGNVRATTLAALAHQDVPFEKIVEVIQPERDRTRNPVFQTLFSLQDLGTARALVMPGITIAKIDSKRDTAKFELQLLMNSTPQGYRGLLEYDADLFDESAMQRFAAHFIQLAGSIVANPDVRIDKLSLMNDAERAATLARGVGRVVARDTDATVVSLVRAQIAATPDAIALELGPQRLTYAQLGARANVVTRRLQAHGVVRGDRVAICAERTMDVVSAVLGVLSAGACYVPIDPAYPSARAAYMLEQSRARVLLATSAGAVRLPPHPVTLLLDEPLADDAVTTSPEVEVAQSDLAYVLYTSGSTGVPKGVAMGHGAMVNLLEWQKTTSAATAGTRTLQFASLSFDVSFQEIFSTWCTGGTLVLVDEDTRRDSAALVRLLAWKKIERVFFPFIALEHLADAAASIDVQLALREIITAGEQLRITPAIRALVGRLPGCELANQYGPTETHVVTALTLSGDPELWPALPSIGRAIDNVSTHVLDAAGEPVTDGLPGELYLGGLALAHGYLDDAARTTERFVAAPEGAVFTRLYRTGDLARVRGDGTLDYLGRADDQVKVRGFRVELGEIERVLSESPLVVACAVALRGEISTTKRLIAYCVLREGTDAATAFPTLQAWCRERLPDYMLPAGYVPLDALPLTPSGKIARRALPDVDPFTIGASEFRAPRTPLETDIAAVWAEVLRVPRVGIDDNFFELGGHSLLATRMVSRVRDQTKRDVPLRVLFDHPVLAAFVAAIDAVSANATSGRIVAKSRDAARRPAPPVRPA
ncbi:MAG: amino acid adenylation domain-containing protein [bacterium]